ncbi:MAG: M28 family peptidase [Saprospiraceae bacterium]|nr:M28 family peptidase [Saprospiraceae bacterium]
MKFKLLAIALISSLAVNAQIETPDVPGGLSSAPFKRKVRTYKVPDGSAFAATIKADDLKALLSVLASDSLEGRETGENGQRKAAAFIAQQFKEAGIPAKADRNSYFQKVLLRNDSWKDLSLKVGDQEFKNRADYYVFPAYNPDVPELNIKETVFVGFGIEDAKYNDYDKLDVKGKAVIFYDGEPLDEKGNSRVTGTEFRSQWSMEWRKKVQLAKQKGAVMVFIVDPNIEENLKKNRKLISTYGWKPVGTETDMKSGEYINNMFVSPAVANAILGDKAAKVEAELADIRKGAKYKSIKSKSKIELNFDKDSKTLEGSNVLAVIEGSDETLKKEFVFITAHYDHLGMADSTVIYHGADDNGSGTSAVVEIARAFQEAKNKGMGPKRTVVCMLVSGEEKGLLGSLYYTEFPIFPLDRTVVDINIDMVGRHDDRHANNPDYVYVIGSDRMSTELHDISEMQNEERTKLELDYKYNAKDDPNRFYERSDHYNFAEKGIPAIFYFNGTHADYHRPTDTVDKIDFNALAKRAQLAFYTAWEIANRPNKLMVNVPQTKKKP